MCNVARKAGMCDRQPLLPNEAPGHDLTGKGAAPIEVRGYMCMKNAHHTRHSGKSTLARSSRSGSTLLDASRGQAQSSSSNGSVRFIERQEILGSGVCISGRKRLRCRNSAGAVSQRRGVRRRQPRWATGANDITHSLSSTQTHGASTLTTSSDSTSGRQVAAL
jgi:hypothetical protein